mmetsp:Transcript_27008/g.86786  ORF Transcript_27008/g.86786 Transcript_27008/m.86786 type:complete len:301 (+) Transcript_27008:352-1254(+)
MVGTKGRKHLTMQRAVLATVMAFIDTSTSGRTTSANSVGCETSYASPCGTRHASHTRRSDILSCTSSRRVSCTLPRPSTTALTSRATISTRLCSSSPVLHSFLKGAAGLALHRRNHESRWAHSFIHENHGAEHVFGEVVLPVQVGLHTFLHFADRHLYELGGFLELLVHQRHDPREVSHLLPLQAGPVEEGMPQDALHPFLRAIFEVRDALARVGFQQLKEEVGRSIFHLSRALPKRLEPFAHGLAVGYVVHVRVHDVIRLVAVPERLARAHVEEHGAEGPEVVSNRGHIFSELVAGLCE